MNRLAMAHRGCDVIHPIISQMGNRGLERDRLVQGHPERWTELGREARLLQLWLPFPAQHPHSRWTVVRTCRGVWGLKALEAGRELWGGHALPSPSWRGEGGAAAALLWARAWSTASRSLQRGRQGSPALPTPTPAHPGAPRLGEPGGPFQTPNPSGNHFQAFPVNPWDPAPLEMQSMGRRELSRVQGMAISLSFSPCSPGA